MSQLWTCSATSARRPCGWTSYSARHIQPYVVTADVNGSQGISNNNLDCTSFWFTSQLFFFVPSLFFLHFQLYMLPIPNDSLLRMVAYSWLLAAWRLFCNSRIHYGKKRPRCFWRGKSDMITYSVSSRLRNANYVYKFYIFKIALLAAILFFISQKYQYDQNFCTIFRKRCVAPLFEL